MVLLILPLWDVFNEVKYDNFFEAIKTSYLCWSVVSVSPVHGRGVLHVQLRPGTSLRAGQEGRSEVRSASGNIPGRTTPSSE